MLHVSMEDFLRTGELGPIHLGLTHGQVHGLLGDPDDVGGASRRQRTPTIWKYGDIELYFADSTDRLTLIHADDFDVLSGGRAMEVAAWIIRRGIALSEVTDRLDEAHIPYQQKHWPYADNTIRLAVGTNVTLVFAGLWHENGSPMGLHSISCSGEGW